MKINSQTELQEYLLNTFYDTQTVIKMESTFDDKQDPNYQMIFGDFFGKRKTKFFDDFVDVYYKYLHFVENLGNFASVKNDKGETIFTPFEILNIKEESTTPLKLNGVLNVYPYLLSFCNNMLIPLAGYHIDIDKIREDFIIPYFAQIKVNNNDYDNAKIIIDNEHYELSGNEYLESGYTYFTEDVRVKKLLCQLPSQLDNNKLKFVHILMRIVDATQKGLYFWSKVLNLSAEETIINGKVDAETVYIRRIEKA